MINYRKLNKKADQLTEGKGTLEECSLSFLLHNTLYITQPKQVNLQLRRDLI